MSHFGRRLFPSFFISNVGHNQSASRIVTLTFLTKSVSNEVAFFVQRGHPYRAFLCNHIRTNFTCSRTYRTVNLFSSKNIVHVYRIFIRQLIVYDMYHKQRRKLISV